MENKENKMKNIKTASGFTLIELIVVIVVIGVLAAVALPRYISLTSKARIADLQGLQGSIYSAVVLAQAEYRAEGNTSSSTTTTISMDNTTVTVVAGTGSPSGAVAGGIGSALSNTSGFALSGNTNATPGIATFGFASPITNCSLTYNDGAPSTTPTVTLTTTGC